MPEFVLTGCDEADKKKAVSSVFCGLQTTARNRSGTRMEMEHIIKYMD